MKLYLLMCLMSVTIHIKSEHRNLVGKKVVSMGTCSGVFISPTNILTAAHCIEDTKAQWVMTANKKTYTAYVKKVDKVKDLALLTVGTPYYPYASLGEEPEITDPVYTCNSGEGLERTYGAGIVENIIRFDPEDATPQILDSIQIMLGASGSGLFDATGKLIGINVAKVAAGSLAVNTEDINNFIHE